MADAVCLRLGQRHARRYHYRRSFTQGDTNYEAQFWFARYAFESAESSAREQSKSQFRSLREAPLAHEARVKIRDVIGGEGTPNVQFGRVVRREFAHGFIERDGFGDWVFCHKNASVGWDEVRLNARVQFQLGFSFGGAVAMNVTQV